jgi:hypothetical protein
MNPNASSFSPSSERIANQNLAFSGNPVCMTYNIIYKRWGGFGTERFLFPPAPEPAKHASQCMAIQDKLQTPSNAGMVVSASSGERIDCRSFSFVCCRPFDARDALQVVIDCMQTIVRAAQATLGHFLNSTTD